MNYRLVLFFILGFTITNILHAQTGFDKRSFFNAMASHRQAMIDGQLVSLKKLSGVDKEAFEGAMLMRKSALMPIPAKRLAMFKKGYQQLETALKKNPDNPEYRFLRLMIQENAPKFLGYNKDINQDSKFIKENYKSLSNVTKESIAEYSKQSKSLSNLN